MIVDNAIYVDGRRSTPRSLKGTHSAYHDRGGFAWIGLYGIMDQIVDDYAPVAEGLESDIYEIETEVFGGSSRVSRRTDELFREVLQSHRATQPLAEALEHLLRIEAYGLDGELRKHLRDVRDHTLRVTEQVKGLRGGLLSNITSVNLTLVSANQNDEVKKISALAAILVVPTIIMGIYRMNFEHMPELAWTSGYPFALALMMVLSVLLTAASNVPAGYETKRRTLEEIVANFRGITVAYTRVRQR